MGESRTCDNWSGKHSRDGTTAGQGCVDPLRLGLRRETPPRPRRWSDLSRGTACLTNSTSSLLPLTSSTTLRRVVSAAATAAAMLTCSCRHHERVPPLLTPPSGARHARNIHWLVGWGGCGCWWLWWWWCGRDSYDDVFIHIAARLHRITMAEHLGVRLPASPPPGALDNQTTVGRRGRTPGDSTSGWTESEKCRISEEKRPKLPLQPEGNICPQQRVCAPTRAARADGVSAMNTQAPYHVERKRNPCPHRRIRTTTRASRQTTHRMLMANTSTKPRRTRAQFLAHSDVSAHRRALPAQMGSPTAMNTEHKPRRVSVPPPQQLRAMMPSLSE